MELKVFVSIIKLIQDLETKERNLELALREYGAKDLAIHFMTDTPNKLADILSDAMNDKSGYINWWLWDANCGNCEKWAKTLTYEDGSTKIINTATDLYDVIMRESDKVICDHDALLAIQGEGLYSALYSLNELAEESVNNDLKQCLLFGAKRVHNDYIALTGQPVVKDECKCKLKPNLLKEE